MSEPKSDGSDGLGLPRKGGPEDSPHGSGSKSLGDKLDPAEDEGGPQLGSMRYFAIGSQFAYEVLGFVLVGVFVDYYWGITPWGVVAIGLPGCFLALFHLIRSVSK